MSRLVNECFLRAEELDGAHLSGAARLWATILRRALADYVFYGRGRDHPAETALRGEGESAEEWIFGGERVPDLKEGEFDLTSFESVCGYLGFDPALMRAKVRGMTEDKVRRLRGMEYGDE